LLIGLIVYLWFYVKQLLRNPNGLLPIMCIGLGLGILFFLWMVWHKAFGSRHKK